MITTQIAPAGRREENQAANFCKHRAFITTSKATKKEVFIFSKKHTLATKNLKALVLRPMITTQVALAARRKQNQAAHFGEHGAFVTISKRYELNCRFPEFDLRHMRDFFEKYKNNYPS